LIQEKLRFKMNLKSFKVTTEGLNVKILHFHVHLGKACEIFKIVRSVADF